MRQQLWSIGFVVAFAAAGCATTSNQDQRRAQMHQHKSDVAASNAAYGVAGDEQRKAEDSHHSAVKKAIDTGQPIPQQTQPGDPPPNPYPPK